MAEFLLVEIDFEPLDFEPTLEDEFTMTTVLNEIESVDDIEQLRLGAKNLLKVALHRQAVIRGLCKRLAQIETRGITTKHHKLSLIHI